MINYFQTAFQNIFFTNSLLFITCATCITIFITTTPYYISILLTGYLSVAIIAIYTNNKKSMLITLCMILCSLLAINRVNNQYLAYKNYGEYLDKPVTIEGTISRITHSNLTKSQLTILIQTSRICFKKNELTVPRCISIFTPAKSIKNLQENQTVKISNCKLEQPINNKNYEYYLLKEGIWATAHCTNKAIEIIATHPKSMYQNSQMVLQNNISQLSKELFDALFLGKKQKNYAMLTMQHQCAQWGISHHMARSGAHLAILLGLLWLLLHYMQLSHEIKYILSLTLLLGYAHISYPSISFTRALYMSLLFIICKFLKLMPSALHILTLITLFIMLYNPAQIFFLDFQLSFGISYIIIWLFTIKNKSTIALFSSNSVRSQ